MVALTWLFTTREMLRLQTEYAEHKTGGDIGQKLQHEARMFRSQRNFYLCGSCALLLLVIRRIYQLVREVQSLSASRAALEKQAMGAVAAYNAMAADKTPADKTPSSKPETTVPPEAKAASSTSAAEPLASEEPAASSTAAANTKSEADDQPLQEENATLQRLVASLEAQRDAATKNADALKRQAEGLSTEYARLTREKEKLENRLSDFELLMGDAAKKRA